MEETFDLNRWRSAFVAGFLPFWIGGIVKALLATASVMVFRNSRGRLSNEPR